MQFSWNRHYDYDELLLMPEINLEPHQYGRTDPRTGKMVREFSKKWARNWFFVCATILLWDFFNPSTNWQLGFGFTAFWAFIAGVMAQHWLKDIY